MSDAVTTIIPTFRRPQLLRRAIQSALEQTHRDVLVCVYDNASGDETAEVVRAIAAKDGRVRYYCHEQHIDVAHNFLFGMQRVATPYFSFLSDDDVLFPTFYAAAIASLRGQPDALFAAGSAIEFDESGSVRYAPLAFWKRAGRFEPPEGFFAMLHNRHPTWTAILFRAESLQRAGAIDAELRGPVDLDYELAIAARFPYVTFFAPSAGYVHHEDRVSAVEDASVIASYRRMSDKLAADPRIDQSLRTRLPALLQRQMRAKLHEIAFKSVAGGKDENAAAAAALLRSQFGRPLTAACIELTAGAARRFPPLRTLIARAEAWRLRRRAAGTRRRLLATTGSDGSDYARFLLR